MTPTSPLSGGCNPKEMRCAQFFEAGVGDLPIHGRVRIERLGKMPDGSHCNRIALIAVQSVSRTGSR